MLNLWTPKSGKNLEKAWNFKESFWGLSWRFWCLERQRGSSPVAFDGARRAPSNDAAVDHFIHQNLHENPQNDSLKFHAFSMFLPLFGVQRFSMGTLFFYPTPEHWKPLENAIRLITPRKRFVSWIRSTSKIPPAPPTMLKSMITRPPLLRHASILNRYTPPVYI